jgi:hypothetical protein
MTWDGIQGASLERSGRREIDACRQGVRTLTHAMSMPWPSPYVPRSPGREARSQKGLSDWWLFLMSRHIRWNGFSLFLRIIYFRVEEGKDLVCPTGWTGARRWETGRRREIEGEAPGKPAAGCLATKGTILLFI